VIAGFRSPFRFDSYEPRFAIEDFDTRSLVHAVELWQQMSFKPGPVTFAAKYPNALLLCAGDHHPPIHPFEPVSVAVEDVVAYVRAWFETATVEEPRPNFDGDEFKGFCAFPGYFVGQELEPHAYDCFVVVTKWIEIHK
jgi:hypothetical protein